jgi:hypothetical protein
MKTGFFRQERELKRQKKNPGSALRLFEKSQRTIGFHGQILTL